MCELFLLRLHNPTKYVLIVGFETSRKKTPTRLSHKLSLSNFHSFKTLLEASLVDYEKEPLLTQEKAR